MKTLTVKETTIDSSGLAVVLLTDETNKRCEYIYVSEINYMDWVNTQIEIFKSKGYEINDIR